MSITTGEPQTLILDEKDRETIKGKKVVIVDDVISTGSTLQGMRMIIEQGRRGSCRRDRHLYRGRALQWMHIISLGHLPLFTG